MAWIRRGLDAYVHTRLNERLKSRSPEGISRHGRHCMLRVMAYALRKPIDCSFHHVSCMSIMSGKSVDPKAVRSLRLLERTIPRLPQQLAFMLTETMCATTDHARRCARYRARAVWPYGFAAKVSLCSTSQKANWQIYFESCNSRRLASDSLTIP